MGSQYTQAAGLEQRLNRQNFEASFDKIFADVHRIFRDGEHTIGNTQRTDAPRAMISYATARPQ